jgi:hypothetical protein
MLYIFGDSHTRNFMNINNIAPFCIGAGQSVNLNDKMYENIITPLNI